MYTIRVENDAVQVAPGVLQRVAEIPDLFSEGQQLTPVRPLLEIDVGGKSLSDATHQASCCGVDLKTRPGRVRLGETAGLAEWTVVSGQVTFLRATGWYVPLCVFAAVHRRHGLWCCSCTPPTAVHKRCPACHALERTIRSRCQQVPSTQQDEGFFVVR